MVISGCVGSLIMLPGATLKRGHAAGHGRRHATARAMPDLASADAPEHFQMRLGARVFGRRLGVVALGLIQIPVGRHAQLVLRFLALEVLLGQFEGIGGLFIVVVGLRRDPANRSPPALGRGVTRSPSATLSATTRPLKGVSTAAVRAGSDSTTAGSSNLGLTGLCRCRLSHVKRLRSAEPSGTMILSPCRTINWGSDDPLLPRLQQSKSMGQQDDEQQHAQADAAPQKGAAAKIWLVIMYRHGPSRT